MLTPEAVEAQTFTKARRGGYTMTEVDNFLDQITQDYRALYAENADLRSKLKILADKINEYRETEDIMRATLYNAQKTANEIVSEAESKREGILDALEQDIRARKTAYDDEIAVCRSQLAEARRQTAEYLAAVQDLTDQQQAFLENLPDLGQGDELPNEDSSAEAPQADEPAAEEASAPEEDTIDEMIAQEAAAPAPEEESAPQEPEQPQQEAAAAPAAPASTARIDFSNLKFGKDYEIK